MKRAILLALALIATGLSSTAHAQAAHPNVVILLTDDQRWDKITPEYMPEVSELQQRAGSTSFTQAIVPNSLCCPSRTSILTGQYSHTTGVWYNKPPYGGFEVFNDAHTIATDFQDAGYRTAMIGKYLNGYEPGEDTYVPPGWSKWFALSGGSYFNYDAVRGDGSTQHFGYADADYASVVLGREAQSFVTQDSSDPFLLYLSFTAPHERAVPQKIDRGRFAGEVDMRFGNGASSMLEAAYGADRQIGQLLDVLPPDTIIVFMSDNGYMWGEHGIVGKMQPYEGATRVPLIINGIPGLDGSALVANVDLRPTLSNAAGVAMSSPADGLDLTTGSRSDIVLEFGTGRTSYCGVRTSHWMFARYINYWGEAHGLLFDLDADYAENHNLAKQGLPIKKTLKARAKELCSPIPPGFSW